MSLFGAIETKVEKADDEYAHAQTRPTAAFYLTFRSVFVTRKYEIRNKNEVQKFLEFLTSASAFLRLVSAWKLYAFLVPFCVLSFIRLFLVKQVRELV